MPKKYVKTKDIPKKDRFCRKCYRSVEKKLVEGLCPLCHHHKVMLKAEVDQIDKEYNEKLRRTIIKEK